MAGSAGLVVVVSAKDDSKAVFEAVDQHLAKVRASAAETNSVLSGLTNVGATLGITLGLQAAVSTFTRATTSALAFGETLEKAAAKTGLSVSTLSTLHYAATVTNSDFDGITTAVARMDKQIGAAADGNKEASAVLRSIGLDAKDLAGRSDGAEVALRKLGVTLANTSSAARRNELATALTGRGGVEQVALLQRLGTNFDEFREKAAAAGVQLGDETAARLAKANEQLRNMQERVRGAALGFTDGLIPAISALAGLVTGSKGEFDDFSAFGRKLGQGVAYATAGVYGLLGGLTNLRAKIAEVQAGFLERQGDAGDSSVAKQARQLADELRSQANAYYKKGDDADLIAQTGFARGAGERISDHRRQAGQGSGGYTGTPNVENAEKLANARRELNDANRKAAEEAAQAEANQAKSHATLMLSLLEDDYRGRAIPEATYFARKLELQKASIYAEQAADVKSYGALSQEKTKLAASPGSTAADQINTKKRIVELSTEQAKLADRILDRTSKIEALNARDATDAALRVETLRKQSDELAAQREAIEGGPSARLKQSADEYAIRRQELLQQFTEGSPEIQNADAVQAHSQHEITARGADQAYGVTSSQADVDRQRTAYDQRLGEIGGGEAREQDAAAGQRQAKALEPVLKAYEELARGGDLQATEKVAELQEKIYELKNPIDEVSAHLRDSFDSAFETLFLNFDQGAEKAFENFGKSFEQSLEKALYAKTVQPAIDRLVGGLTSGLGFPATQQSGAAGSNATLPKNTGVFGSIGAIFRPFTGGASSGGLGGGAAAQGGKVQINITLKQDEAGNTSLDGVDKQGDDTEKFEVHLANSFASGGVLRQLLGLANTGG